MKKFNKNHQRHKIQTSLFFWVMCAVIFLIIVAFVTLGSLFISKKEWTSILTSVTKDFITAIIVTTIVGTFVKMIADKFFIVKKNDKQLREFGVFEVGSGKSTKKDVHDIFGYKVLNIYPIEIKMLYITGNRYLEDFKEELTDCLAHGCHVKILLISTEKNNEEYVRRLESLYNINENDFSNQIQNVKTIISQLKVIYPDKIKVRFYRDEYSYNFRSAKYFDDKKGVTLYKNNINVQPFDKPAIDCSIGLAGTFMDTDNPKCLENNIFYRNNATFDRLWEKYKETEFLCDTEECK